MSDSDSEILHIAVPHQRKPFVIEADAIEGADDWNTVYSVTEEEAWGVVGRISNAHTHQGLAVARIIRDHFSLDDEVLISEPEFTQAQHEARAPLIKKVNELIDEIQSLQQEMDSITPVPPRSMDNDIFGIMRDLSKRNEELCIQLAEFRVAEMFLKDTITAYEELVAEPKTEQGKGTDDGE